MSGFLPSADQEQLIAATARAVSEQFPATRLVSRSQSVVRNRDLERWDVICGLEWPGLMLPEAAGGPGCSLMDLCLVHRELARGLLTPVLTASMLAARLAWQAGDQRIARSFSTGRLRAAFAVPCRHAAGSHYLLHAQGCSHVLAWNEEGASLHPIEQFTDVRDCEAIEDSLELQSGRLSGTASAVLRLQDPNWLLDCSLLLAAQLAGGARASLDLAIEYAKVREQFGQPIGAFQAIKHKAADMLASVEVAWGEVVMAALQPVDSPGRVFHASAAKILAAEAALKNAAACIQIHGGMGFTAEVTAHLYLKRAHTLDLLGGLNRHHHQRILQSAAPV
jgi:alkylation response protein AidB-like acyl-CoA dehydrogenase